MQRFLLLIIFSPLLSFCQLKQSIDYIYPDSTWQSVNNLSENGWNSDSLHKLKSFIINSTNATGMVVIQSGKVLFDYGDVKETSYLASCRKSILSILYGPFVKNGKIDLSTTIDQLHMDDIGGLLPIEKKATIKDLLTARSGVYHAASNEGDASAMAPKRGTVEPGKFWLYNNWDFNAAGYILEQQTGRTIYQLIDSILARPLQMQDWNIKEQRKTGDTTRSKYLAYHIWLSTRDMARVGYLMLRNGKWKDQQIIPADWIKTTTSVVSTYKKAVEEKTAWFHFGYSYLWWVWDEPYNIGNYQGAYSATGAYGQFITVLPRLDLVIAFKTKYDYGRQTPADVYLKVVDMLIAARKK